MEAKDQMVLEIMKRFARLPLELKVKIAEPYFYCALEYFSDPEMGGWTPEEGPGLSPVDGQEHMVFLFAEKYIWVDKQAIVDEVADRMLDNLYDMMDSEVEDYLGEIRSMALVPPWSQTAVSTMIFKISC